MTVTRAQYQQLREVRRSLEKYRLSLSNNGLKEFPYTNWVDMAASILIASGGKFVQFKPYNYQINCIDLIKDNYLNVIAKGRQLGLSQIICTWLLFRAITEPGFNAVVISKTQNDSSLLGSRIRQMANQMSDYFSLESDSLLHLKIKNSGQIFFRNSTPSATRGIDSVSVLFFDECAFIPDFPLIFSASAPSLSMVGEDARIILNSTPNGLEDCHFGSRIISHNPPNIDPLAICNDIRNGKIPPHQHYINNIGSCIQFIHWKCHELYSQNPNYIEDKARILDEPISKVRQEYDLEFEVQADSVFSAELVRLAKTPEKHTFVEGSIVYIGADFAGSGKDYTVFTVCQENNGLLEMIDMYRSQDETLDNHILVLADMIEKYEPIGVGIESTGGIGMVALQRVAIECRSPQYNDIKTTNTSKLAMIEQLKYTLEKQLLQYNEKKYSKLTGELLNYRRLSDSKLGAGGKGFDDIVMSLAFCIDTYWKYSVGKGRGDK